MRYLRRTAGLRRGGSAGRGGEGSPRARPGGGEELRGEVPRQPHHRESGSGACAQGGHGVRPAHPAGHSGGGGGDPPSAGGRGLSGRAEPQRCPAPGDGRAAHGADRRPAGHPPAVRARPQRGGGDPGRRRGGLCRGKRGAAAGASQRTGAHDPAAPLGAGTGEPSPAGLCRRHGAGEREAGAGDRRRRRPQHPAGGLPRRGQVHAGAAAALHPAGHDPR